MARSPWETPILGLGESLLEALDLMSHNPLWRSTFLDHFDDFSKGVIDTSHLTYYLSFITFGLFLTAKSVDSEHWRG